MSQSTHGMDLAKQYRFPVGNDCSEKLDFLKKTSAEKGITFNGDCNKGSFWGHGLMCNYFKVGKELILNIESVPAGTDYEDVAAMLKKTLGL
jgi:hypothetical protein